MPTTSCSPLSALSPQGLGLTASSSTSTCNVPHFQLMQYLANCFLLLLWAGTWTLGKPYYMLTKKINATNLTFAPSAFLRILFSTYAANYLFIKITQTKHSFIPKVFERSVYRDMMNTPPTPMYMYIPYLYNIPATHLTPSPSACLPPSPPRRTGTSSSPQCRQTPPPRPGRRRRRGGSSPCSPRSWPRCRCGSRWPRGRRHRGGSGWRTWVEKKFVIALIVKFHPCPECR